MGFRALRRAFAITVGVGLLSANAAFADVVRTDGDIVDTDLDSLVELGPVAPGTVIEIDVGFELQCGGFLHVESFQSIVLTPGIRSIPPGAAVDYTGATIDAPGAGWPVDGDLCGTPPDPVKATLPAQVTLTAPMTVDEGYLYTLSWSRAMSPAAPGDFGTLSGLTAVTFTLDVVSNTPPTLSLPAAVELEGDRTGGAVAAYTVGAADAEDDPDPVVKCTPAPGADVSLGTTTVTCSATDFGWAQDNGIIPSDRRRHHCPDTRRDARRPVPGDGGPGRSPARLRAADCDGHRRREPVGRLLAGVGRDRGGGYFQGDLHGDGRQRQRDNSLIRGLGPAVDRDLGRAGRR